MEEIISILQVIKKTVDGHKNLGIFCSGGFDSTTLLYTICHLLDNEPRTIKVCTVPRHDNSAKHVIRVMKWIEKIFPNVKLELIICGDPDLHHSQQVLSGVLQMLESHQDTFFYLADTKVPDNLKNEHAPERYLSSVYNLTQPFFNYDKTFVINLADSLNVLDKISIISHTCTERTTKRCKKCWQCIERSYSFEKLNLIDIGQM